MLIRQGDNPAGSSERPAVKRQVDEYRQSREFQTYEALCRGENTQVSSGWYSRIAQWLGIWLSGKALD